MAGGVGPLAGTFAQLCEMEVLHTLSGIPSSRKILRHKIIFGLTSHPWRHFFSVNVIARSKSSSASVNFSALPGADMTATLSCRPFAPASR